MTDLMFYTAVPSRGAVVRWMLEEVGEPYDAMVLDLKSGEQNQPAYRAVNPQGKVPALKYKGQVTTEVAAICTFLADEFSEKKLNIPAGDRRRGPYLSWLFFNSSAVEPAMMDSKFPRQEAPPPTAIGYRDMNTLLDVLEAALKGKAHLMGDQFTAADVVTGSGLRFGMTFGMIPQRPSLMDYVARLTARPAFKRAVEKGVTGAERALNYAATSAFRVLEVLRRVLPLKLELDDIKASASAVCRPGSDCYDIDLRFFSPADVRMPDYTFRFTVDVSDVIPVLVDDIASWTERPIGR